MEATATAPETAPAQPQELETPVTETKNAQPDVKGSAQSQSDVLAKLLKLETKNPDHKFTPEEYKILDSYYAGEIKPTKKEEKPPISESEEPESEEEAQEDESEESEDDKEKDSDPDLESAMKEVGAKSTKELLDKIAGLKKLVGSRDAQAVAKVTKELETFKQREQSEIALWRDFNAGVPEAVAEMNRRLGNRNPFKAEAQKNEGELADYIDEENFIDPDSAKAVNSVIRSLKNEISQLKKETQSISSERQRYLDQTAETQAETLIIDEMVHVAQAIPELKDVPNLRDVVSRFYKGEPNPKLEVFQDIYAIATEENVNLKTALLIKKGRDADRLIQEARQGGIKEAYSRKPAQSLSDIQTGDEGIRVKQITEADLDAMEQDERLIPQEWFDKDMNLDKTKIPKKAWKRFGL